MTTAAQTILEAALELPDDERAELAAILADSVGDGRSSAEIQAAWIAEAKCRLEAVRAGEMAVIPTERVELELEQLLAGDPLASRRVG